MGYCVVLCTRYGSDMLNQNHTTYKDGANCIDHLSDTNATFSSASALRKVTELPEKYRNIFSPHATFNVVQSRVFDSLLNTDTSIVVSAPTGSGKTALFELAIVRSLETSESAPRNKMVYIAPVKALCSERYVDWSAKFRHLGIRIGEMTGDSNSSLELTSIENVDLILTTPEKWDALTRRWKDHSRLVQTIKLFMIDEVHLLNEERRGPTLEVVVSRMQTVQEAIDCGRPGVRFVAVSATIPNIADIAKWLETPRSPAIFFKFDESVRPVNLKKIVLGYPLRAREKAYMFDVRLTYKLKHLIMVHANGKPTLIFCSSRKSVQQTCFILKKILSFTFTQEQTEKLQDLIERLLDNNLRELVRHGLAYHHAGLMLSDRQCLEEIFRSGYLPVLISTSTLAMGVNLPARLVIIKTTEQYLCGEWQSYSESQVLQMMGRAGRPQFDSTATAVIMTRDTNKIKYEKLVSGQELIESSLHNYLVEHLNAEIVLGTITDIAVATSWLRSTFLYIRALKNPKHYGIPANITEREIEAKLQAMCMRELHALEKNELIATSDFAYNVQPTENGKLMARYYIAFETMKVFMQIEGTETLAQLLMHLTRCHEFQDVHIRRNEKPILNNLNRCKRKDTIRFPLEGKIVTKAAKANVLIQAVLGSLPIPDAGLLQESSLVMRLAERLLRGMSLYLGRKNGFQAFASALTLRKCIIAKMWENSQQVCRQLPGIGPALSTLLLAAGKASFTDIVNSDPRTLERIINRPPPMGNTLQEAASRMPQYHIDATVSSHGCVLLVQVRILNSQEVQYGDMLHSFTLLISSGNYILRKEVVSDQAVITQNGRYALQIYYAEKAPATAEEITVSLISNSIVGVDVKKVVQLRSTIGSSTRVIEKSSSKKAQETAGERSIKKPLDSFLKKYSHVSAAKMTLNSKTMLQNEVKIPARDPPKKSTAEPTFSAPKSGAFDGRRSDSEQAMVPQLPSQEPIKSGHFGGAVTSWSVNTPEHNSNAAGLCTKTTSITNNVKISFSGFSANNRNTSQNTSILENTEEVGLETNNLGFDVDALFNFSLVEHESEGSEKKDEESSRTVEHEIVASEPEEFRGQQNVNQLSMSDLTDFEKSWPNNSNSTTCSFEYNRGMEACEHQSPSACAHERISSTPKELPKQSILTTRYPPVTTTWDIPSQRSVPSSTFFSQLTEYRPSSGNQVFRFEKYPWRVELDSDRPSTSNYDQADPRQYHSLNESQRCPPDATRSAAKLDEPLISYQRNSGHFFTREAAPMEADRPTECFSSLSTKPKKDIHEEAMQHTPTYSKLPQAVVFKKRRCTPSGSQHEVAELGTKVCTSLSSLLAIHSGYQTNLNRSDIP